MLTCVYILTAFPTNLIENHPIPFARFFPAEPGDGAEEQGRKGPDDARQAEEETDVDFLVTSVCSSIVYAFAFLRVVRSFPLNATDEPIFIFLFFGLLFPNPSVAVCTWARGRGREGEFSFEKFRLKNFLPAASFAEWYYNMHFLPSGRAYISAVRLPSASCVWSMRVRFLCIQRPERVLAFQAGSCVVCRRRAIAIQQYCGGKFGRKGWMGGVQHYNSTA